MPHFFELKKDLSSDPVPETEGQVRVATKLEQEAGMPEPATSDLASEMPAEALENRAEGPETLNLDPENPGQAPVKAEGSESVGHLPEKSNHAIDMTTGNSYSLLLRFSLPLLLGNIFQQLYNTVDSMVVGNMVGKTALAAVGAGFPFLMAMVSFFMGMGIASTVLISQAFGARDFARINRIMNTIYVMFAVAVLPLTLVGVFFARPVLQLMNVADDGTLQLAVPYICILFGGIFATMGYNLNSGCLQGLGDSITSLKLLILSTVINIVLDVAFVLFGWGVVGVALATVLAQTISWIMGLVYINTHYDFMNIHLLKLSFDRDIFQKTIRLGLPSALQGMLFSLGSMVLYSLVNSFGQDFMAGFTGANKIDTLAFFPAQSFSSATTTFTGQNVGAKKLERVREGLRSSLVISCGSSLVIPLILYIIAPWTMRLFSPDPAVIASGVVYLRTVLPFYWALSMLFTVNGLLRGVGFMHVPLLATVVSMIVVRVPSAYILAATFGRDSIFYSYGIGWIAGSVLVVLYYFFGNWRNVVLERMGEGEKAL